jgi:uncharacterized membrane protein
MLRLKSIDTFRGIAVIAMIWLHLSEWWLSGDSKWFLNVPLAVTQYGFLVSYQFISGVSRYLFYKTGGSRSMSSETINSKKIRRDFFLRGLILLIVALLYNSVVAINTTRPSEIWSWYILLAISISLILITPLLKTSKKTRVFLGVGFLLLNYVLLSFLQDFKGQANLFGILFHILFYPTGLHPILSSFAVFLIGTVVGDILYEVYYKEDKNNRNSHLKKRLILPAILIGGLLVVLIFFSKWLNFINLPSFYGVVSSLGMSLILFSLYVIIEEYKIIKTKNNHKFLFYFSYYSLTIYLAHNVLYFLFFESLNVFYTSLSIFMVVISIGLFFKAVYPKLGSSLSIKKQISRLSYNIVMKLEKNDTANKLE